MPRFTPALALRAPRASQSMRSSAPGSTPSLKHALWTASLLAQSTPQTTTVPRWVWWAIIAFSAIGLIVLAVIAWASFKRPSPPSAPPPDPPSPQPQPPIFGPNRDAHDAALVTMACPLCSQHYNIAAQFCILDGSYLERVEDDATMLALTENETRCPTCDALYEPGSIFCPDDFARLILEETDPPIDAPSNVLICPACRSEHPPPLRTCPHDLTPLVPIIGRFTTGLSKRAQTGDLKVCPHCSKTYRSPAAYCSVDGSTLVDVN